MIVMSSPLYYKLLLLYPDSYSLCQLYVIAILSTVGINTCQQYFASPALLDFLRPLDSIKPRSFLAAINPDLKPKFPFILILEYRLVFFNIVISFCIYCYYNALFAKDRHQIRYQFRVLDCGGVDRDLVCARKQDVACVFKLFDAASNCERYIDDSCHLSHDASHCVPPLLRRSDVKEH